VWAGAFSWCKIHLLLAKHTQTMIDVTQKEITIDQQQQQHSCETLICQRHQTIPRFLSTAATANTRWRVRELYCQTSWCILMSVEQSVEWELAGETEVLGENLSQCHFVNHKSHLTWPEMKPRPPLWEAYPQPDQSSPYHLILFLQDPL
jgi:hypothetical protein